MFSSFLTDAEYRGKASSAAASSRLQTQFAELSAKVNAKLLAAATAESRRSAATGQNDWFVVGDQQAALAGLITIAQRLGVDAEFDPRHEF